MKKLVWRGLLGLLVLLPVPEVTAKGGGGFDLGPIPEVDIDCRRVSKGAGSSPVDPSLRGTWLQFRGDRALTGRSELVGEIRCPEVLWQLDLGARQNLVSIEPSSKGEKLDLPIAGEQGDPWQTKLDYRTEGALIDLDGDGYNRVDPSGGGIHKIGDFLPEKKGFEKISCADHPFSTSSDGDDPLPCYLARRVKGEWKLVWKTKPLPGFTYSSTTSGQPLIGDFDLDGEIEVAVIGWYEIYLLSLASGEVEATGVFRDPDAPGASSGRGYGWFGAFDVTGDEKREFVILGDFEKFISVIGWRGGELTELWDHQIEAGVSLSKTAHHPGVAPVADADGDGRPEIVTSIFNERGDGSWWVVGFDGASGEVEFRLKNRYLSGMADLDGDGVVELMATKTKRGAVPEARKISVVSFRDDPEGETLWSKSGQGFEIGRALGFPDHVNSAAVRGYDTAILVSGWGGKGPAFVTRDPLGKTANFRLRVLRLEDGEVKLAARIEGPRLRVVSPSGGERTDLLLQAQTKTRKESTVTLGGALGGVETSGRVQSGDGDRHVWGTLTTSTVVGPMEPGGRARVITQTFDKKVRAYEITDSGDPELLWEVPGRGMYSGGYSRSVSSINQFGSLLLADLEGDGAFSLVLARQAFDGQAQLRAIGHDGQTIWTRKFNVDGGTPGWRSSGVSNWLAGNFRDHDREDVAVSVEVGGARFGELHMLDGKTGEKVWRLEDGGLYSCGNRAFPGSSNHTVFDWDGDGLDEMLNTNTSLFAVYDGEEAEILFNRWMTGWCGKLPEQVFDDGFLVEALSPVTDFMGSGEPQILYGKNPAKMALLDMDGEPFWEKPSYDGFHFQTLQGIGDFDGDGELEVLAVGHCKKRRKEIRAFEGASGKQMWTLPLPSSCDWPGAKALATADLDGDGRDEALVFNGNVLHAIGENTLGKGEVLWTATFEPDFGWNEHGVPVVADVDGSGRPQILINTASGYLIALGERP